MRDITIVDPVEDPGKPSIARGKTGGIPGWGFEEKLKASEPFTLKSITTTPSPAQAAVGSLKSAINKLNGEIAAQRLEAAGIDLIY